ncbi:hypothetical protein FEM48_Zijuj11G0146300 [Ziziphus jujuba var. spinosa]|uniref:Uncharacterized protein n=1 Tax=Ziziphus jujuba var. spinosa TaxID=714518 RepID=A0A978UJI5_ZIZJJ|nr:hypothetical protein FEM48_Zijuj11G0146300 [Ziziphus jujuba var. spinosa]
MVLWEIALVTAYFLGLRQTHRLSLTLVPRITSPKYPGGRRFLQGFLTGVAYSRIKSKIFPFPNQRRGREFNVAFKVQRNILQEKAKEVGWSSGNWIPSWMKPSYQNRVHPPALPPSAGSSMSWTNQETSISFKLETHSSTQTFRNLVCDGHLFTRLKSLWNNRPYPGISMTMRLPKPTAGTMTQSKNLFINRPEAVRTLNYNRGGLEGGVIRKDIRQWIAAKMNQ